MYFDAQTAAHAAGRFDGKAEAAWSRPKATAGGAVLFPAYEIGSTIASRPAVRSGH